MSLIRTITSLDQAGYGVNIRDREPPAQASRVSSNRVGIVGNFPWGPQGNDVYEIRSVEQFRALFAPPELTASISDYPSLGILAARIPTPWYVRNVQKTGGLKANSAFLDGSAEPVVTLTAKHAGAVGNQITCQLVAGSTGSLWTVEVRVGTYKATYADVVKTSAGPAYPVNDPFVDMAFLGGTPIPATVDLMNGANGTAGSAQWTGTAGTFEGVRAFLSDDLDIDLLFAAMPPTAVIAALNQVCDEVARVKLAKHFCATVPDQDVDQMIASSNALNSDFSTYHGTFVEVPNPLGEGLIVTDPNAFAVAIAASGDVSDSIGAGFSRNGLRPVVRVIPNLSKGDYDALFEAGVCPVKMLRDGAVFYGSRTTNPSVALRSVSRRRIANFVEKNAAVILERQLEHPLDVDVEGRTLGGRSQAVSMELRSFLNGLAVGGPGVAPRIRGYEVDFFSSTDAQIRAGVWIVTVSVATFAPTEKIIINASVGPTVIISEG